MPKGNCKATGDQADRSVVQCDDDDASSGNGRSSGAVPQLAQPSQCLPNIYVFVEAAKAADEAVAAKAADEAAEEVAVKAAEEAVAAKAAEEAAKAAEEVAAKAAEEVADKAADEAVAKAAVANNSGLSQYELERQRNIAENQRKLAELGLASTVPSTVASTAKQGAKRPRAPKSLAPGAPPERSQPKRACRLEMSDYLHCYLTEIGHEGYKMEDDELDAAIKADELDVGTSRKQYFYWQIDKESEHCGRGYLEQFIEKLREKRVVDEERQATARARDEKKQFKADNAARKKQEKADRLALNEGLRLRREEKKRAREEERKSSRGQKRERECTVTSTGTVCGSSGRGLQYLAENGYMDSFPTIMASRQPCFRVFFDGAFPRDGVSNCNVTSGRYRASINNLRSSTDVLGDKNLNDHGQVYPYDDEKSPSDRRHIGQFEDELSGFLALEICARNIKKHYEDLANGKYYVMDLVADLDDAGILLKDEAARLKQENQCNSNLPRVLSTKHTNALSELERLNQLPRALRPCRHCTRERLWAPPERLKRESLFALIGRDDHGNFCKFCHRDNRRTLWRMRNAPRDVAKQFLDEDDLERLFSSVSV